MAFLTVTPVLLDFVKGLSRKRLYFDAFTIEVESLLDTSEGVRFGKPVSLAALIVFVPIRQPDRTPGSIPTPPSSNVRRRYRSLTSHRSSYHRPL